MAWGGYLLSTNLNDHRQDLRDLFVGLNMPVISDDKKKPLVNFDNAATTPPFRAVLEAVESFAPWYGAVHRGGGAKSETTTHLYEEARRIVADFVGADRDSNVVIFVKNTTEAINKLAYRLIQARDRRDIVISTVMEHHSNDLPWRGKFRMLYVNVDDSGRLLLDDLEKKLRLARGRVRLVTVTGASNVTGHINPLEEIAGLAHRYGAEIMVDGAQMVPHLPVSMKGSSGGEPLDYLAFSGHKMYAPFGTGFLIGPRETFNYGHSEIVGGGTVEVVSQTRVRWAKSPQRDEAGTPNVMGVIALTAAIEILRELDMRFVNKEEAKLANYARKRLSHLPNIKLYGDQENHQNKLGIIPFNIKDLPHGKVALDLANHYAIAVRSGCFCAQPYIQRLLKISLAQMEKEFVGASVPYRGMVRVSFGLYNTESEVDLLAEALENISNQAR